MGPLKSGVHTLHKQSINATYNRAGKDTGMGKHMQYSSTKWIPHKSNTAHKRERNSKTQHKTYKKKRRTNRTDKQQKMGNIYIPQLPNKEGK
jgi:sortase (surface protein transpeptidase)